MNAITPIPSVSNTLASRAMILTLTISQWSGRRLDREITDEVNQSHNAAADAGRYNKLLLDKDALKPIQKIANETRDGFNERTLPWKDGGRRIVVADVYMQHARWLSGQIAKFDKAVDDFIDDYPKHVAAARVRLNGMFKDEDYPSADAIRAKFRIVTDTEPVPTSDDFRVAISDAQAQQIRDSIERSVAEATTAAVRDVYRRIAEVAERMVDRLNAYKPAKGKGDKSEGIFRDSLVENVRDLIAVLPALNITGDPTLTKMADDLKPLAIHSAQDLRESEGLRKDVAKEAQQILDRVSEFLA